MGEARDTVTVSATFDWVDAGPVGLDGQDKVVWPQPTPDGPGLYRFTLTGDDQRRTRVYIGEAMLLRRRLTHYRSPGPSQHTNIRLNQLLVEHLRSGGTARLALADHVRVRLPMTGGQQVLSLATKAARLLAESAAIVQTDSAGEEELLNL